MFGFLLKHCVFFLILSCVAATLFALQVDIYTKLGFDVVRDIDIPSDCGKAHVWLLVKKLQQVAPVKSASARIVRDVLKSDPIKIVDRSRPCPKSETFYAWVCLKCAGIC